MSSQSSFKRLQVAKGTESTAPPCIRCKKESRQLLMNKGRKKEEEEEKGKTFRREIFYVESYEKYQCEE